MSAREVSSRMRLILPLKTSVSLRCGNGSSGTSTPKNSHKGAHPSPTSYTSKFSAGTCRLTSSLCRSNVSMAYPRSSNLRNRSFKRIKDRSGVREDLRFHDLRHTCATLLLSEGVNAKVVSEMLGHASITITLNTYSHVLPDMQDTAADAMEAALGALS